MNEVYTEIARYSETLPEYHGPLELLRKITEIQSLLLKEVSSGDEHEKLEHLIDPADASGMIQSGQPLFGTKCVPVSASVFLKGLQEFSSLLQNGYSTTTLDRLLASKSLDPGNIEAFLNDLQSDIDACIQRMAKSTSAKPDTIRFLLRTSLAPFFQLQAGFYQDIVAEGFWSKGICPICGSEPSIARLVKDCGRRFLVCFLCGTEWVFDRLRCPFCEHKGPPKVRHFTVDDDEAHRVECCDNCKRYLKTVDDRIVGHQTSPAVEDIITLQLDIFAKEQGYRQALDYILI
ncbi:MAG: formate dehydrogenase accessory protein FdhE [Acidobacteriota bacterium]